MICLFAGEESGDRLGAALMRALRAQAGGIIDLQGVGGREMTAEGLQPLVPSQEFASMGFSILLRAPALWRYVQDVTRAVVAARPDVFVIVDSPELTHQVARRVRKRAPSIPIVNYVSPSVWAWRPGRARTMRAYVDHVLALLPFEPAAHARLGGPPCTYVGHSVIERLTELRPDAEETARRMSDPPQLLVLPGSRTGEIRRMLGVFGEAIDLLQERGERFKLVLPTLPRLADTISARTRTWSVQPRILVDPMEHRAAFRLARAALTKSGTVTLELALAGVPMAAAYKVSLLDEAVGRIVLKVPSIILANLVLGENVVPEFIQRDCTPQALADCVAPLLHDTPERRRQVDAFARLDTIMEIGKAIPSRRAAEIVLRYAAMG